MAGWLGYYRATLLAKCDFEAVTAAGAAEDLAPCRAYCARTSQITPR